MIPVLLGWMWWNSDSVKGIHVLLACRGYGSSGNLPGAVTRGSAAAATFCCISCTRWQVSSNQAAGITWKCLRHRVILLTLPVARINARHAGISSRRLHPTPHLCMHEAPVAVRVARCTRKTPPASTTTSGRLTARATRLAIFAAFRRASVGTRGGGKCSIMCSAPPPPAPSAQRNLYEKRVSRRRWQGRENNEK